MTEQQQQDEAQTANRPPDDYVGISQPLPDDQQTLDAQESLKRKRAKEQGQSDQGQQSQGDQDEQGQDQSEQDGGDKDEDSAKAE